MTDNENTGKQESSGASIEEIKPPEGMEVLLLPEALTCGAITMTPLLVICFSSWAYSGLLGMAYFLILATIIVLLRRGVRKFVREHGPIEIITTLSPSHEHPKKHILFREVGEIIDDTIDRVLDGKRPTTTEDKPKTTNAKSD